MFDHSSGFYLSGLKVIFILLFLLFFFVVNGSKKLNNQLVSKIIVRLTAFYSINQVSEIHSGILILF